METILSNIDADIRAINAVSAVPLILETVLRTTGMGYATIARVTKERWVACAVVDKIAFGLLPGGELDLSTTLCNEVREFSEPIVVDNFDEDEKYKGHHTPAIYGLKSYIAVPIRLNNGMFFGTLCAIHPEPAKVKNPETISMFKLYAELIAMHLSNNEQLSDAQKRLHEEMKIGEIREQFIAILGHDLRNPLTAVKSISQLMQHSKMDEAGIGRLGRMLNNSYGRMSALIENLMDFARGRLGTGITLQRQQTELKGLLMQVVDELQLAWPGQEIELEIDLSVPVFCDAKRMAQLFSNLLANAITHGERNSPVHVVMRSDNTQFILSVANSGEPIPSEIIPTIFEPFSRGQERGKAQGLGLGLFISAEIAKAHGARLRVTSTADGTVFTLELKA